MQTVDPTPQWPAGVEELAAKASDNLLANRRGLSGVEAEAGQKRAADLLVQRSVNVALTMWPDLELNRLEAYLARVERSNRYMLGIHTENARSEHYRIATN